MSFKPNDKVVCIRVGHGVEAEGFRVVGFMPNKGPVYVVDAIISLPHFCRPGLALVGSTTIHRNSGVELGWDSDCFRLVIEAGHPAVAITEAAPAALAGKYGRTQVAAMDLPEGGK